MIYYAERSDKGLHGRLDLVLFALKYTPSVQAILTHATQLLMSLFTIHSS